ncbi:MAG: hypothetical protein ACI9VI_003540, partial [Candidatus Azotimanducaceae bacterium]
HQKVPEYTRASCSAVLKRFPIVHIPIKSSQLGGQRVISNIVTPATLINIFFF